jgi:hypothetical protein
MSVKVCVINGAPGSGKTTFENICREKCNMFNRVPGFNKNHMLWIDICSTVDFVKELAFECGWDGTKTLKNRKFLSDLKDLLTEWDDVPFKKIEERAQLRARDASAVDWILFVDCREPAEIQKLKERLNAITVLIRRDSVESNETSNHADANVMNYNYDLTIFNNSDIIDLENRANDFIKYLRGVSDYEYDY